MLSCSPNPSLPIPLDGVQQPSKCFAFGVAKHTTVTAWRSMQIDAFVASSFAPANLTTRKAILYVALAWSVPLQAKLTGNVGVVKKGPGELIRSWHER